MTEKWMIEGEARAEPNGSNLEDKAEILRKFLSLDFEGLPESVRTRLDAEVLRKFLTLKFGGLPESALTRVSTATRADLDRWLKRMVSADKLEAVLDS